MNSDSDSDSTDGSTAGASGQAAAEGAHAAEASAGEETAVSDPPEAGAGGDDPEETPQEQIAKLRERLLRTAADFDNYRKRARRDVAEAERRVQEDLIRALLPTFDNVERATTHAESAKDVRSIVEGLQMVMKQFKDTLGGMGIERVESVGNPFDPAEHEAVQHLATDEVPAGAVVRELQAGYRWQGRLVRPSLVVVARAADTSAESGSGGDSE